VLAGLCEPTQHAYLRSVRQLGDHHQHTCSTTLEEQQVKDDLLWIRAEKRSTPGRLKQRTVR